MCAWLHVPPSLKSYIILTFPPTSLEQFLRAIRDAVSQAIVFILSQYNLTHTLTLGIFFSWHSIKTFFKKICRASLVAQWLRICLLMQGTRVRALAWEDPTCHGATRPVSHNYWACVSGACAPQREAAIVRGPRTAMKSGPRSPQLEKALAQKRRPNIAINQSIFKIKKSVGSVK